MEVVVVFPCVPATATDFFPTINIANASALVKTSIPALWAAVISTLVSPIAPDAITRWAPLTFSASWPINTSAPSDSRESTMADRFISDPLTLSPSAIMMRAIPLMPAPPMPTK